jgi:hypothetical protein
MARMWPRLAGAVMVVWLAAACTTGNDVADVEAVLVDHYLDPLAETGITASVQSACRYAGPVDLPWHLDVALRLDAAPERVADFLEREGMVVRRDREPMTVQQVPGAPNQGWNGTLRASEQGSVLNLVFNNVTRSGWTGAVGWADVCPDSVRPGETARPDTLG